MDAAKRKTVLALLFLSVHALVLAGCWDRTEVNDLAIITAAGLDLTDDGQLELSVKIYLTSPAGTQQMGGSDSSGKGKTGMSVVRSATGSTVADAASKLQQRLSRKMFWGQDEVFVFGERLARQGLAEPLEFLLRHPAPRERGNVFVSKGSAKEVLQLTPPIERSVADVLRKMARSKTQLDISMSELAQMMAGRAKAAVLPLLAIKQDNQDEFPFIDGTAVLKNGKMVGSADAAVTRGIMWLRNEVKRSTVTVAPANADGKVSFQLLRSRTRLVPHIDEGDWSLDVRIETWDEIVENATNLDVAAPKHIDELEAALGDDIRQRVNSALTRAQKEWNADIFQFADAFYRKYPKEWNRNKDRWDEIYPKLVVRLETKPKVSRPGLIGKSPFGPNQR
jgi:spore germination protein KC